MREIDVSKIKDAVRDLCLKANFVLRPDILKAIRKAASKESGPRAKSILRSIVENARIAKSKRIAICQDTGMVVVMAQIGQEITIVGGSLIDAIEDGVREAYKIGCLRKSVVAGPLSRINTNTNTPSVIYTEIVKGDSLRIVASPKGFGSENKSSIKMLNPTAGESDIRDFVLDTVKGAGPDACPPFVVGIGIGGTFEKCAYLAKKALMRPIDIRNLKKDIARLEKELLKDINSLGIGPMGLGGKTTALGVNIEEFPTHIAGLPVAVNMSCHATRSAEEVI